jgi:uncharacterized protein (DUF2062 family)
VEGTAGVVFKRRDQRGWIQVIAQFLWPRGGWARAFQYVQHRLRRLPGTPEQIARGIFAGAVTVFTPFFGLHFVVAALLARIMRGSILASLLATFIGNPLTYVPIAIISLQTGHFLLGTSPRSEVDESVFAKFGGLRRPVAQFPRHLHAGAGRMAGAGDLLSGCFLPLARGG